MRQAATDRAAASPELTGILEDVVRNEHDVLGVYLFGSRAWGDAHPGSDIDLGVTFSSRDVSLDRVLDLEARFERALDRSVDLVDIGTCDPFLALDIVRGERIYCADEQHCDELDLYVMRRAADLAPFERERRRMLLTAEPSRKATA